MQKKRLGRIFSSKFFYIMFSLVVAAALWMWVEATENPERQITFNATIEFRNELVLHDRGLVITSISPEVAELSFEGAHSVTRELNSTTVHAVVDLVTIMTPGVTSLTFETVLPRGIDSRRITETTPSQQILVTVERLAQSSVSVIGEYFGGAAEDYIAEEVQFSPQEITVYGPQSAVEQVHSVWVQILRENLSSTLIDYFDFIVLDEDGNELGADVRNMLRFSHDAVRVTIPVSSVRSLPLMVELIHGAGTSDLNTTLRVEPGYILVSGDPEAFRGVNYIRLGTINTQNIVGLSGSENFQIIVPGGFTNLSGETQARVLVQIYELHTETFTVTNIEPINIPIGYVVTFINQSISITLRGDGRNFANLTADNIRVEVDLADYSAGRSRVEANVIIDGDFGDVAEVGTYHVIVTLSRP